MAQKEISHKRGGFGVDMVSQKEFKTQTSLILKLLWIGTGEMKV